MASSGSNNPASAPTRSRSSKKPFKRKTGLSATVASKSSGYNLAWLYWASCIFALLAAAIYHVVSRGKNPVTIVPKDVEGPFQEVQLPGKGIGLIAMRDIEPGELLIREAPLFLVPPEVPSPLNIMSDVLERLQPHERDIFMNLSYVDINYPTHLTNGAGKPEDHPLALALAIFQTNAVSAGSNVGLFPRMARLNHGCARAFNSVYSWREDEGVLVIHAIKPIAKGHELLTAYTDTKRPREQRRRYLKETYGFNCACACCSLSAEESRQSDIRLGVITMYYERLAKWADPNAGLTGPDAVGLAREIISLGNEEQYVSERGRLGADAAWVAAAHSDADAVKAWASLARKWYSIELGQDSREARDMARVIFDPKSHSAWGTREVAHVGGP